MSACLFCRIVTGELPADIVDQGDDWVAFRDIDPKAPLHVLVIPRRHVARLDELNAEDAELLGTLVSAAARIAAAGGYDARGYRVVVNTGADAGQSVHHIHFHVLAGRRLSWPPG